MAIDYDSLPLEDLQALKAGKYDNVSLPTLEALKASESAKPVAPPTPDNGRIDGVPEWGRKSPNLYAGAMTALDLAPTLASFAKATGVGIPLAGAINAGAKYAQRQISGDETDGSKVLSDFAKGATVEGLGRAGAAVIKGASNIPAIQQRMQNAGRKLYQSAMKFSNSPNVLSPAERNAITETGLKNNFMPNDESYLRLKNTVSNNSQQVDDIINAGTQAGDTVPAQDVLDISNFNKLARRGEAVRGVTPGYSGSVNTVKRNFIKGDTPVEAQTIESAILDPQGRPFTTEIPAVETPYTPSDINTSKRQLYKELEDAYGKGTLSKPSTQAKKQLAAGLKSTLEGLYPEVKKLNADSAELLALSDHLARSMGRIGNRDVIGLGDKIVLDMVTGRAANPTTAAAGLLSLIDRPQIKARVAQVLYKANTGKNLPLSQWKKGLQYVGQVAAPTARAAFEGAMYTTGDDPLGIR